MTKLLKGLLMPLPFASPSKIPGFTLVVAVAVAVPGASSARVTEMFSGPGAPYVCVPETENEPFEPVTVPAVVVPSPQLTMAARSLAAVTRSVSVKVATVVVNAWCTFSVSVVPLPES